VNRRLQFQKCREHFIGARDKPLSVAVSVSNPDRSPLNIQS
jgi:hypothetical protein